MTVIKGDFSAFRKSRTEAYSAIAATWDALSVRHTTFMARDHMDDNPHYQQTLADAQAYVRALEALANR